MIEQTTLSRRERAYIETVAEIKSHARRQMVEKGAVNISLRAIAREMGMSSPALFHYFPSYDALITALIIDAFNASADALADAITSLPEDAHRNRIAALTHAYRTWALANPQDYLLINGMPIPGYTPPPEAATTGPAAQRTLHIFIGAWAAADQAGILTLPDLEGPLPGYEMLQKIWTAVDGTPLRIPLLHKVLTGWAMLRGLIAMELYGGSPDVMKETFELELEAFLSRAGL